MNRFHVPADLLRASEAQLPEPVARQITRVLRLRPGARIVLFCGDGFETEAELLDASSVRLLERRAPEVELPCELHCALAVLKGEKLDWTLQKLTELGAARVTLLLTERTIVAAGEERWPRRLERYRRIVTEAAEQSGRVRIPEIAEPVRLADFLQRSDGATRLLLDPEATRPLLQALDPLPDRLVILSGPEGGFSQSEVALARESGAVSVSLGPRVLRAETAPLAAAAIIGSVAGR